MKAKVWTTLGVAMGVFVIGVFAKAASTPTATGAGGNSTEIDHSASHPFLPTNDAIGGVAIDDAAATSSNLPFRAFDPAGLGTPTRAFQTDPSDVTTKWAVVEFDFDTEWGPVVVEELAPSEPISTWSNAIKVAVSLNGQPYTHGTAAAVTVRGGKEALLLVSEDGSETTLEWYETRDMKMELFGPSLPSDIAVKIAEDL
ncbi:MAG: hypothetical protein ABI635_02990 [Actinomycetota bacterium]